MISCALVLAALCLLGQVPAAWGATQRTGASRRLDEGQPVDAHAFEPGACVEYPPTTGDRHLTVFLDAGHGGIDPGGVGEDEAGDPVDEADETLPVELDTMALLRTKGFTVVVSRTGDETVSRPQSDDVSGGLFTVQGVHDDVAARDRCADLSRANVLVGIYFDAGASSLNAGSVTGYDSARPFSAQNLKLANLVQNDVLSAMNAQGWSIPSLGVIDDSELGGPALSAAAGDYGHLLLLGPADLGWFTTPSTMPGALIEPLFITDPFEASIAESQSGQRVISAGLAQAVEQFFAPAPGGQNSEKDTPRHHRTRQKAAA
ncbi:MAG TPA: N-acetylmuramoyl-L-alanine amidase [Acidimicrobiales bacterium]|jgi:N-acetylmuramoyl-L-alanine amidase